MGNTQLNGNSQSESSRSPCRHITFAQPPYFSRKTQSHTCRWSHSVRIHVQCAFMRWFLNLMAAGNPNRLVKSSVKSRFKMAVAFPPPLVPIAGASGREGRSRRNRHHWIAPSRGIIPIFLILSIAAHRGFNIAPFQEVYSTAMQHGSRPTMGAVGDLREGCSDGPRCR
jgi:hypothetical protein